MNLALIGVLRNFASVDQGTVNWVMEMFHIDISFNCICFVSEDGKQMGLEPG